MTLFVRGCMMWICGGVLVSVLLFTNHSSFENEAHSSLGSWFVIEDQEPRLWRKFWSKENKRQEYVQYAYEISSGNISFVWKLEAENSFWNQTGKAMHDEPAYGFCQFHVQWHSDVLSDPRFATDWKRQIRTCYEKRRTGTPMYGNVDEDVMSRFYWE